MKGEIWVYLESGKSYLVMFECKTKMGSNEWVDGVVYHCPETGLYFTRDKETFLQKFAKET